MAVFIIVSLSIINDRCVASHCRRCGKCGKQDACHQQGAPVLLQELQGRVGVGLDSSGRRGLDGIGVYHPVGVDGGVLFEHGGDGHLGAADGLGVPAVKGVALHGGGLGHGRKLAAFVGVDHHGGAYTSRKVHADGMGLALALCKCRRHCKAHQSKGHKAQGEYSGDLVHGIPHFPDDGAAGLPLQRQKSALCCPLFIT